MRTQRGVFVVLVLAAALQIAYKSYWLAPERRKQAWAKIQVYLLAFGNAAVALMFFVFQLAMLANLSEWRMLSPVIWVLLAAFVAFVGGCLFRLFRAFRLPPGV